MIDEEKQDDLDFAIEFHSDYEDCIACVHWSTKAVKQECLTCDSNHCNFEQDTDLQIMKNITNFNEGFC